MEYCREDTVFPLTTKLESSFHISQKPKPSYSRSAITGCIKNRTFLAHSGFKHYHIVNSMKKYKNTLQKGSVRYIVFKENNVWYAVGLEFNIVESGDTPQEAILLLSEALSGYVESAKKIKSRPNILNQTIDREYETMWQNSQKDKEQAKNVFSSGFFNVSQISQGLAVAA